MRLVESWIDIRRNLSTLYSYFMCHRASFQDFYRSTLRQGICFVSCKVRGKTLFGPSRFIGYRDNTKEKHLKNFSKHGGITNARIEGLLSQEFRPSRSIESAFRRYCRQHGVEPEARQRKFIAYGEELRPNDADFVQADLEEISNDKSIGATEKKRLVMARLGQGDFRRAVRLYWHHCPVTGCRTPILLIASHIKPWRACSNNERLDGFNGLLVAPNVDALFDTGLITFNQNGQLLRSRFLHPQEMKRLGIKSKIAISVSKRHKPYLEYHRRYVFQG